jgi:hypothetical protein
LTNICIILTGHWVRAGRPPLEEWWKTAQNLKFITEGDDAIIPLSIINREVTLGLNVSFSAYNDSKINGGSDFLKTTMHPVWVDGRYAGKLVNTFRMCRSLTHVKGYLDMRISKTYSLWRAKALSLLYLAPHHPLINPLCKAIGRLTAGCSEFKGWRVLAARWGVDFNDLPGLNKKFPDWSVSETMRAILADSLCPEIPPISILEQIEFERQCETWDGHSPLQIPASWMNYPEWQSSLIPVANEQLPLIGTFICPVAEALWKLSTIREAPRPPKAVDQPHYHCLCRPNRRKRRKFLSG